MDVAVEDHILEVISDSWGASLSQLLARTFLPARLLQKALQSLQQRHLIRLERGRYVLC